MIHFKINCTCTVKFKNTEICSECAKHDHHEFVKARNFNLPARNDTYQSVLDGLISGRKWRVQTKPNAECGHPGVRNTAGKCVFCPTEKRSSRAWKPVENSPSDIAAQPDALRRNIATLDRQIAFMTQQRATTQNALPLSQTGYPVGPLRVQ